MTEDASAVIPDSTEPLLEQQQQTEEGEEAKTVDPTTEALLPSTAAPQPDEECDPAENDASLLAERLKILKQATSNSVGYLLPRNIQREQRAGEHVVQFDDESLFHCDFSIGKV